MRVVTGPMPPLSPSRAVLLQRCLRSQRPISNAFITTRISPLQIRKASSASKHPRGFQPPTTADLDELRDRTLEFVKREIPPDLAQKTDQENEFPSHLWRKLGDAGFLGITADEDQGGLAMGYQAHCIVLEELSRASGSIGLSYAAHSQLCINQLQLNGTPEQKSKYLPALIKGEKVGALAMSEYDAGSDVVSMRMTATPSPDGDGYVLDGTKMWITNGPDADIVIVYAKTSPQAGSKGITAFIVETTSPGFSVAKKLDKLGMRGSNTGELNCSSLHVPASNVLGSVDKGVSVLMEGLDLERLVLSAGPLGLMKAALDITLPYVHTRKQFGEPLAHNQFIQGKLAEMYTKYLSASALTHSVARAIDEHHDDPEYRIRTQDCAAAILFAAERATECGMDAIQCLGGMGYVTEIAAGRVMRDAKLYEIGAGTTEVRKLIIGRAFNKEYGTR